MSVNPPEGTLTIENSHLDVKGNVSAVALKLGTLRLTPSYGLDAVANVSNSTTHTLELSNATTGLVTTSNLEVGGDVQIRGTTFIKANSNTNNLAIGTEAGQTSQGTQSIAVGYKAGETTQGTQAVAVGYLAGQTSQGDNATAVGRLAGQTSQGDDAIAVGNKAARTSQGTFAVAVGCQAGETSQGTQSIAIGNQAGRTSQHDNSIVLNASGSALNTAGASRTYIKPLQAGVVAGNMMAYDSTSGEVINYTGVSVNASGNMDVSGNLAVDTNTLFVDSVGNKVGIGTASPGHLLQLAGNMGLGSSSQYLFRPTYYYYQTYQGTSGYAHHYQDVNNAWTLVVNGFDKMYIRPDSGVVLNNFTGQHRSFVDNVWTENIDNYVGLIVSANKNTYTSASFNTYKGNRAIQINESLPDVRLSNVAYDKSCFGVISSGEDPESREDTYGSITVPIPKEKGDTRTFINSVGEGAIWVTNINGPLESGDYITTSNVAGYGQKQDSEFLANYTVAKITMDCDFNPQTQPVKQIKREMGNVDYWLVYRKEQISKEDYDVLPDTQRRIDNDGKYYQLFYEKEDTKDPLVYETEQRIWIHEAREELVNSIDENGIFIWEDHPTETEKAYEIRYLDADGNITDEANHVYKAAFVGCTYHCG